MYIYTIHTHAQTQTHTNTDTDIDTDTDTDIDTDTHTCALQTHLDQYGKSEIRISLFIYIHVPSAIHIFIRYI